MSFSLGSVLDWRRVYSPNSRLGGVGTIVFEFGGSEGGVQELEALGVGIVCISHLKLTNINIFIDD